jgi:hypothetical protein
VVEPVFRSNPVDIKQRFALSSRPDTKFLLFLTSFDDRISLQGLEDENIANRFANNRICVAHVGSDSGTRY